MSLPENVFRTADLEWEDWTAHPSNGFGLRTTPPIRLPLTALGSHLEEVPPGHASAILHYHLLEEELFYLVSGTLTVRELVPGADHYRELALRAGELIAYPADTGIAHQFINRSDAPARFISLSDQHPGEVACYPDAGKVLCRAMRWLGVVGEREPAELLAQAAAVARARPVQQLPLDARPAHVVARVAERDLPGGLIGQPLGRAAGARAVFANRDRLPPGTGTTLHAHTANEELCWVLTGTPTLHQRRGTRDADGRVDFAGATDEHCMLQPGDVICWPAGEPLAHRLSNESAEDAVVLVVGLDRPEDVVLLPESGEVRVARLGLRGRFTPLAYMEGEVAPDRRHLE